MQKKPHFKSKVNAKEFTAKQCKQIATRSTENIMLIVMALLADKHKFDEDKLEKFMVDVQFASTQITDMALNRTEILAIIKKHTGFEMERV